MILIRQFENGALDLYSKNIIKGSIHLYTWQKVAAAGVCEDLNSRAGDTSTATHRGHGHVIAIDADPGIKIIQKW